MDEFDRAKNLFLEGLEFFQRENFRDAEARFTASLDLLPDRVSTLTNLAATHIQLLQYDAAEAAARRATELDPTNATAWANWGLAANGQNDFPRAVGLFERALAYDGEYAEAWNGLGVARQRQRRPTQALAHFDRALALKPGIAEFWLNKAAALADLQRGREAIAHLDRALLCKPGYAQAWADRGHALVRLKHYAEALENYGRAITLAPQKSEFRIEMASWLIQQRRPAEALAQLDHVLARDPDAEYARGERLEAKLALGRWTDWEADIRSVADAIANGKKAATPFRALCTIEAPALQHIAAAQWAESICAGIEPQAVRARATPGRLRIGYLSADFRQHPVAVLSAGLFERHDRKRVEIVGFSLLAAAPDDAMRARLVGAFDQFVDLEALDGEAAAARVRALEIDIAVDMGGYTSDARLGIFAHRAAPVQVSYLGYPGTLGVSFMDYIVADRVVLPETLQPHFSEKIAYLPHSFMPDDPARPIAPNCPPRQAFGLPETGFVFCAFNRANKILPDTFERWTELLARVPGSVLWLSENGADFSAAVRDHLAARGLDPARIVFATRVPASADHLARHRLADLFLDTLPYNAHATAVDALRAGLPVLTCAGSAFAGRVAASLLTALEMPELIAPTPAAYVEQALALALDPARMAQVRQKLVEKIRTAPLFDADRYATDLEAAYFEMHRRAALGLPPETFDVAALRA